MKKLSQLLPFAPLFALLFSGFTLASTPTTPTGTSQELTQVQEKAGLNQVNINSATAAQLQQTLIGIGSKKAEAIVQYREKFGAFKAPEQLLEVSGFGQATLEKNRDRIVLE